MDDIAGLREALAGGAARIELCTDLGVGGLTPPAELIEAAVRAAVPVHVLIRPRAGDFLYDSTEVERIAADIHSAVGAGAAGIVVGASLPDTRLDEVLLARLVRVAHEAAEYRGTPVALTLHRVFDQCADPSGALETAIALGFGRVLTSGGAASALAGRAVLAALVAQARGRIRILAAGGIDPANVADILATGVDEVHASCRFDAASPGRVTAGAVRALTEAIATWRQHT